MELSSDLVAEVSSEVLVGVVSVGYERQLSGFAKKLRNFSKIGGERSTHQSPQTSSVIYKYTRYLCFHFTRLKSDAPFLQKQVA